MKPIVVFGLGTGFGIAVTFVGVMAFGYYASREQVRLEKQMRSASCKRTEDEARSFVKERLPSILKAARNNEPNAGPGHIALWTYTAKLNATLAACRRMDAVALGTNVPLATHLKSLEELFSRLDPYLHLWQVQAPRNMPRGTQLLNRIEELQRDLTAGS